MIFKRVFDTLCSVSINIYLSIYISPYDVFVFAKPVTTCYQFWQDVNPILSFLLCFLEMFHSHIYFMYLYNLWNNLSLYVIYSQIKVFVIHIKNHTKNVYPKSNSLRINLYQNEQKSTDENEKLSVVWYRPLVVLFFNIKR